MKCAHCNETFRATIGETNTCPHCGGSSQSTGSEVFGMAMSPMVEAKLHVMRTIGSDVISSLWRFGVPHIVDPRLSCRVEVFYSREARKERVEEQNEWEMAHLPNVRMSDCGQEPQPEK